MTKWKSNDFLYVKLRTRLDTIGGTWAYQIPNSQLLFSQMSKEDATSSWIGGDYQLTDLSHIPRWAH